MEPPAKGRRYYTFTHTECASVGLQLGVVTEKLGVVAKFSVVRTFLTALNF